MDQIIHKQIRNIQIILVSIKTIQSCLGVCKTMSNNSREPLYNLWIIILEYEQVYNLL
jgi:hypothetical protein